MCYTGIRHTVLAMAGVLLVFTFRVRLGAEEMVKVTLHSADLNGVILKTPTHQDYDLGRALNRQNVLLLLFPGSWDPYSVHMLKVLRNLEPQLAALNTQVIAVTPERPRNLKEILEKHDIPFVMVSDPSHQVARLLGSLKDISPELRRQLNEAGVDLEQITGLTQRSLPKLHLYVFTDDGQLHTQWESTVEQAILPAERVLELTRKSLRQRF